MGAVFAEPVASGPVPVGPTTTEAPPPPVPTATAPFADVPAGYRIAPPTVQRDRTFLIALGIVVLLHLGALVGAVRLDASTMLDHERQGQGDTPNSITVELVEAPDTKSKSLESQMGKVAPPAPRPLEQPPPQPPPQPEQQQTPAPPVKAEPTPDKPAEPEKADDGPDPAKEAVEMVKEAALEARDKIDPLPPTPPPLPEASEFLGAAPEGKERAYAKGVRETLAKTKPQLWMNKAEVRVGFLLSPTGEIKLIKILQSSNDPIFDDVVVEWIKRAKFTHPPPDAKPDDLAHVIHYTIE